MQNTRWAKITVVANILIVVLFFTVLNDFFRENRRLLNEKIYWQEKAVFLENQLSKVQKKNEDYQKILTKETGGVVIKELKPEYLGFVNENMLSYKLLLTVENASQKSKSSSPGYCIFTHLVPGGNSMEEIYRHSFHVPALSPGKKATVNLTGEIKARPKGELLIIANVPDEPGLLKKEITLPDRDPENSGDQSETVKDSSGFEAVEETPGT